MKRKVIIRSVLFIIGIGLSFLLESFLRSVVLDLYRWTTNNGIQFVGKNFYLFTSPVYYIGFGITFLLLVIDLYSKPASKIFTNVLIALMIFAILMSCLCAIAANLKIMECTTCDDGIRKLRYSEVNYGFVLGISLIVSAIPSYIRVLKRGKV